MSSSIAQIIRCAQHQRISRFLCPECDLRPARIKDGEPELCFSCSQEAEVARLLAKYQERV